MRLSFAIHNTKDGRKYHKRSSPCFLSCPNGAWLIWKNLSVKAQLVIWRKIAPLVSFLYWNKGYYPLFQKKKLRGGHNVFFCPVFLHIMTAKDERINFNLRLSLISSASWVTVPDHLVLMNTGKCKLNRLHTINSSLQTRVGIYILVCVKTAAKTANILANCWREIELVFHFCSFLRCHLAVVLKFVCLSNPKSSKRTSREVKNTSSWFSMSGGICDE